MPHARGPRSISEMMLGQPWWRRLSSSLQSPVVAMGGATVPATDGWHWHWLTGTTGTGEEDGRFSLRSWHTHVGPPAGRGLETGGGALVSFCALGALAESPLAPAVSLYCVGDIESTRTAPGRTDRRSSQPRSSRQTTYDVRLGARPASIIVSLLRRR